jgi:peptidoglycan hydrolase CwlO-like protein
MTTQIIIALLGGGVITAIVAAFKFKPEKDAIVVTAAQGAATILNGVIDALQEEIKRKDAEIERLRQQCEKQAIEIEGLQGRFGTRHTD